MDREDKTVSLYADDILLYVTEPTTTILAILQVFESYRSYSGYHISWSKSVLCHPFGPLHPAASDGSRHKDLTALDTTKNIASSLL